MFNASEFIADFEAMGFSHDEAVAMARDEVSLRTEVFNRNRKKQALREVSNEEAPPILFKQGGAPK